MANGIGTAKAAYESIALPEDRVSGVRGDILANPVDKEIQIQSGGKKVDPSQCRTCKSRRYVDDSDEGNVSFKTPTHISPQNSAAMVSAHEQQHVANARKEGSKENARLLSANVSLKLAICPECGRSYVEGGTTRTTIQYSESNPYEQERKKIERDALSGDAVDVAV